MGRIGWLVCDMYNRKAQLAFHARHKERRNKDRRDRYFANRDATLARQKKYRKDHPRDYREQGLKRNYKITIGDYNKLLEAQNGLCAICKRSPRGNTPKTSILHVDHDHVTKANRGLLCWACNVGLGMLKDNPELCETAAAYLRGHNAQRA